MTTVEETPISTHTVETLLGRPLNDAEKKYAPNRLYASGIIPAPLPTPRVSIVGSRTITKILVLRDFLTLEQKYLLKRKLQ